MPQALPVLVSEEMNCQSLPAHSVQQVIVTGQFKICPLQNTGGKVLGAHVLRLLKGSLIVGPDKKRRRIKVRVFLDGKLRDGLSQKILVKAVLQPRPVIAEQHDHRRIFGVLIILNEILKRLVRLTHQREVLLCQRSSLILRRPDRGLKVLMAVSAVVLHGDVEDEKGFSLPALRHLRDLFIVGPVAHVAPERFAPLKKLLRQESIEAHGRVGLLPVPVARRVRVHGDGLISLILKK